MNKSKNIYMPFFKVIYKVLKWIGRILFIIIAALMIGFTNAYNDERKYLNDIKNLDEQEQVVDDDADL